MIIRTSDKLVEVIEEQEKQIEELQENLQEVNKVSFQKLDENKTVENQTVVQFVEK